MRKLKLDDYNFLKKKCRATKRLTPWTGGVMDSFFWGGDTWHDRSSCNLIIGIWTESVRKQRQAKVRRLGKQFKQHELELFYKIISHVKSNFEQFSHKKNLKFSKRFEGVDFFLW